jgi:hypothetical protein
VLDNRWTKRRRGAKLKYKVYWADTLPAESLWKLAANLQNTHKIVQTFYKQYSQKLGGSENPNE